MKALTRKLIAPFLLGLVLLAGVAIPAKAQSRVQNGANGATVTTVAYRPPVRFYFGVGPPYYGYPYGYPYGYWHYHHYHHWRHWDRW